MNTLNSILLDGDTIRGSNKMEPWTGSADSAISNLLVAGFTLFIVIGVIIFASKMIFRGNHEGVREVPMEEEKEDD